MLTRTRLVHTAHNAIVKDGVGSTEQVRADCAPFHRIVVHSHAGEAALVRLGVPVKRITRIPHAALAGYADVEPVPPAVPDGVPVALFAGLIRPYKGLADLLDAWPAVRQRVPGAILHVLGRSLGGDDDAARAAATEGVVADLRYAEPGEWAGAMLRADVVVLPYRSIDQSGVLATAIALGRPVIATDVGGFGETLADTDAGLLVPPRDPGGAGRDDLRPAAGRRAARGPGGERGGRRRGRAVVGPLGRAARASCTPRRPREIRREGLVVFAAGYLVHAALALVMRVPIVMYDEYGYFATARRLAGEGQSTHLRYFPGLRVRADPVVPRHARRPARRTTCRCS